MSVCVCTYRDLLMCTVGGLAEAGETGVCSEVSSSDVTQPVVSTDECRKLSHAANCILMIFNWAGIIKTRHGSAFLPRFLSHWLFFTRAISLVLPSP